MRPMSDFEIKIQRRIEAKKKRRNHTLLFWAGIICFGVFVWIVVIAYSLIA